MLGDCSDSCMAEVAAAMGARYVVDATLGQSGSDVVCTIAFYDSMASSSERRIVRDPDVATVQKNAEAATRELIAAARPNRAHEVIAAWSRRYPTFTLVTQNVDGLHERAGTRNVVRFHGSLWELACWERCAKSPARWRDDTVPFSEMPPRCPHCGGLARPGVVWFGEPIDSDVLASSLAALDCDVCVVAGTSAVVYPAAGLIPAAKRSGATTIEINPDETPMATCLDLAVRRSAAAAPIDPRHLARHLAGIVGRIEGGDAADPRLPRQDPRPDDLGPLAQGRDQADSGDDDSTRGAQGRGPQRKTAAIGSEPRRGGPKTFNRIRGLSSPETLGDKLHGIAHRLDVLGGVIRDLDVELFFEGHDQLDVVEAVGAQVVDEAGLLGDLLRIGVQVFDDDLADAF